MLLRSLMCLSIAMFGTAFAAIDPVQPETAAVAVSNNENHNSSNAVSSSLAVAHSATLDNSSYWKFPIVTAQPFRRLPNPAAHNNSLTHPVNTTYPHQPNQMLVSSPPAIGKVSIRPVATIRASVPQITPQPLPTTNHSQPRHLINYTHPIIANIRNQKDRLSVHAVPFWASPESLVERVLQEEQQRSFNGSFTDKRARHRMFNEIWANNYYQLVQQPFRFRPPLLIQDKTEQTVINIAAPSPKTDELQADATGYYAGPSYTKYGDGKVADYGGYVIFKGL